MKIWKNFLSFGCIIILCFTCFTSEVNGAKNPVGKIKIIDGKEVSYDDNAINGSVSDTPLENKDIQTSIIKLDTQEKVLSVPFENKINNYNSVLTSLTMLVNSLGLGSYSEQHILDLLGQTTNTTSVGVTIENTLNEIVKESRFKFSWVYHHNVNDLYNVQLNFVSAIENGNPVIINTTENFGDCYLRGHNTGYPLNNFSVVAGYCNYGEKVIYLDTSNGRFRGFEDSKVVSIKDLSFAMAGKGYVW